MTPTLERRNTTNGFDSIQHQRTSPNLNLTNGNGIINDLFKQKARHDEEKEKYERFLVEEILKRPHLLKKIITNSIDAQRICISLMKQQLNNNSTTI